MKIPAAPWALALLVFASAGCLFEEDQIGPHDRAAAFAVVEGKSGYVHSPYAPQVGYVDVREFAVGTAVYCPYTHRIFYVPPRDEIIGRTQPFTRETVEIETSGGG